MAILVLVFLCHLYGNSNVAMYPSIYNDNKFDKQKHLPYSLNTSHAASNFEILTLDM